MEHAIAWRTRVATLEERRPRMLSLALPKGSLEEQTLLLFAQADLEVKKSSRAYNPTIDDPRLDKVKVLRPQEIPLYVQEGYFDLGISGHDWVQESGADVVEVAELPYAKTGTGIVRMVLAVPDDSPIREAADVPAGSRISTEFPNVTRRYFEDLGIDVDVHFSYGATEAKVPELMDALVDLTETGSTLRRNGLRIVDTVMESTTRLLANRDSWADPAKRTEIEEIRTLLLGVIEARGRVLLSMNVPKGKLESVVAALPAMKRPTVNPLYGSDDFEVTTVADKSTVNVLIPALKAAGAEDILEMPIAKIVR
jgi:ATP phosphoribosyltransferase